MKLIELPNQDPKSFEFAAFKWLVKRSCGGSNRAVIGLTDRGTVALKAMGEIIDEAPDIVTLCQQVQAKGLK